ncbi:MAG: HD domain-containing protein [Bacteroides sp.]|nr:HD domain-containing protein [Prevotella sp.]MCM1408329.1 HD domain-containing protein [Treponema brennaborense]MCM1470439.1 HD domain-containing protein [Bacteroides sp.]
MESILNGIRDVDVLLERILTESRDIVHADAGSIYVLIDGDKAGEQKLQIKYAQNDTQQKKLAPGQKMPFTSFSVPVDESSISGYTLLSGKMLNVPDAYNIPADKPYKFNRKTDELTGYKTTSMLTVPLKNSARNFGVLQIINAHDANGNVIPFDDDAELYLEHFAGSATQALERTYLTRALVMRMIHMAEFRDPKETGTHVARVARYSVEIYDRWAYKHSVPEKEAHKFRDALSIAAMLHDVGKVGISDVILKKTGRFTPEEYDIIKAHTYIGAVLFSNIESEIDQMSLDVALRHHERWDGTGYPGYVSMERVSVGSDVSCCTVPGLAGEEIPLSARIVALADVFDALSSVRVYKPAWKPDDVINEIGSQSGKQFDPEVVEAFMDVLPRIRDIQMSLPDHI